ncbi:hypothetical protein ACA910_003976 [Epithemia clementina (nom. ined.)]
MATVPDFPDLPVFPKPFVVPVEQNPQHHDHNHPGALDEELVDLMDDTLFNNIWETEEGVIVEEEDAENLAPTRNENNNGTNINEDSAEVIVEETHEQSVPCDEACATERRRRQEHLQQPDEMRFGRGL